MLPRMANFTLETRGLVAEGTVLSVYGESNAGHHSKKGSGATAATATVSGGQAAFTGLTNDRTYIATAPDGSSIRFRPTS